MMLNQAHRDGVQIDKIKNHIQERRTELRSWLRAEIEGRELQSGKIIRIWV
jgi:hypothetical protein